MSSALAVSPLNLEERKAQDVVFGVGYVVLLAGILAIMGSAYGSAQDTLHALSSCTINSTYVAASPSGGTSSNLGPDIINSAPYLLVALLVAVLLGVLWMVLLRVAAKPTVYVTLISSGLIMIGFGVYLLGKDDAQCGATSGDCETAYAPLILCAIGSLYLLFVFCLRQRIALTATLIEQCASP